MKRIDIYSLLVGLYCDRAGYAHDHDYDFDEIDDICRRAWEVACKTVKE